MLPSLTINRNEIQGRRIFLEFRRVDVKIDKPNGRTIAHRSARSLPSFTGHYVGLDEELSSGSRVAGLADPEGMNAARVAYVEVGDRFEDVAKLREMKYAEKT